MMARVPRLFRRGLGLFESMLAVTLLTVGALWVSQALKGMVDRHLLEGEARTVATAAAAAKLWVEADRTNRSPSVGAPTSVTFTELRTAGVWETSAPETTPGRRRQMTVWLWQQSSSRSLVFVRARGETSNLPRGIPGASVTAASVGVIPDVAGQTRIVGPDLSFDTASVTPAPSGWARRGDLFAVTSVLTDPAGCTPFLHREVVTGCADANTMEADFTVKGDFDAKGDLDVEGDADVDGLMEVGGGLSVDGGLSSTSASEPVSVGGNLTVGGDLDVSGAIVVTGNLQAGSITSGGTLACP